MHHVLGKSLLLFLWGMSERLLWLVQGEAIFPFNIVGMKLNFIASLTIWSTCLDFLARILVFCSWMWWSAFMLCSAITYWDGRDRCASGVLWPWSQLMSSLSNVLSYICRECCICLAYLARSSLMGQRKLQRFLSGSPTIQMMCLDNTLAVLTKVKSQWSWILSVVVGLS